MSEPAPSAQPVAEQTATQGNSDSTPPVHVHRPCLADRWSPTGHDGPSGDAHEEPDKDLHTEVAQLRRAMQTRPTIDQARGMLMARFRLTPQEAWSVLVTTSQNTNTKLHHLADRLLDTVHGDPLRKDLLQQLEAAVAQARAPAKPTGPTS